MVRNIKNIISGKMIFKLKHLSLILAVITLCVAAPQTHAQSTQQPEEAEAYKYEDPTLDKLSQMYWRLNKFNFETDYFVDNFMLINECQIFKDYYHNEFEWRDIRKVGEKFITENINEFPLRFEFIQPLSLAEYDFDRKGFEVVDEHKINNTRIFEVSSPDLYKDICNNDTAIPGYPRVLRIELSRPLSFDFVPMEEEKAETLILKKSKAFKRLDERFQTKNRLYAFRDGIMVMQVKLFAYKGPDQNSQHSYNIAPVLGVLEGIEIYADRDREDLLYKESFRRKKPTSDFEEKIRAKFKARKEAQKAKKEAQAAAAAKAAQEAPAN